jgi:REP element-mobilizing transposase RayT
MPQIWSLTCDLLRIVTWFFHARTHGFVLMNNHYHWLLSTPEANLDEIVCYFQSNFSAKLAKTFHKQRFRFGTRYKGTLVDRPEYYSNVYRYIYQNPLRAKLVDKVEMYPWSTICGVVGEGRLEVPIYPNDKFEGRLPLRDDFSELAWLNEPLPQERLDYIKCGLSKTHFKVGARFAKSALAPI